MIKIKNENIWVDKLPDRCPFCHELIKPEIKGVNYNLSATDTHNDLIVLELFTVCSNNHCQKSFIGYYNIAGNNEFSFAYTSKGESCKKTFSNTINSISKRFSKIYNEAYYAEQNDLNEICGMGYRKAIEFLIKDYCMTLNIAEKNKIEEMYISNVVSEYINDEIIKQISQRALWLGNDETHYIRKHDEFKLNDLKDFIKSIVDMIEANVLYNDVIVKLPSKL